MTVLGAVYLRLVAKADEVYRLLEPLYKDYRKIRKRNTIGTSLATMQFYGQTDKQTNEQYYMIPTDWEITHVDEIVDALLTEEYYIDLVLPRLVEREYFERNGTLPPRQSVLEEELDASDDDDLSDSDSEQDQPSKTEPAQVQASNAADRSS